MKSLIILLILSPVFVQARTIVEYKYLRAKNSVKKSISLEEMNSHYKKVIDQTFSPPSPETIFNDYLRFMLGVEVALHDKKIVTNPRIDEQISDPFLRKAFHQSLYTYLAESQLKKQNQELDQRTLKMSDRTLKKLYSKEPEFNYFYISIMHNISPTSAQVKEAKARAGKIHASVIKSKKPFLELVALYSDDKSSGTLSSNRSKADTFPEIYAKLKRMKNNSISKPIRIPTGYAIVKLNRKVPFEEANKVAIRANYFNEKKNEIFNRYFDGLKRDFKVTIKDKELALTKLRESLK